MNVYVRFLVVLSVVCPLAPLVAARPSPGNCELAARALRVASRHDADSSFLRRMSACLNDPGCAVRDTLVAALRDRNEALILADQQYTARLDACVLFGGEVYAPRIDASEYSAIVDHALLPLIPGRTLIYESSAKDAPVRVEVTTLPTVAQIQGVECRAVLTVKSVDLEIVETSTNWYAQHQDGSVWWFGELNQHFEDGLLTSLDGSWRAGLAGAQPGIVVPSLAGLDAPFRRAWSPGVVEDIASVRSRTGTIRVPFGTFENALEIQEWDVLEPLELIVEILVPGLGLVAEIEPHTGARLELVAVVDAPATAR